jgi:hypothetical protein
MAQGTFKVKNWKASGIRSCEQHNRRLFPEGKMPKNINPEKIKYNLEYIAGDKASFKEAIDERLKGIKVRGNSVKVIEFVMGASEDFYKGNYSASGYLSNCLKFAAERYGWDNIIASHQHFDEATPHVHVLVTPVVEKTVRWKNQRGEGVRKEKRLCARDITGGPEKLRQMQEDFYKFIVPYGIRAGVEFEPRVLVENQDKEYSKHTDYRMAEIKRIAQQAQQEIDAAKRLELQKEILKQKELLDKELQKKNEAEKEAARKKKLNRGNNFRMR